MKNMNKKVLSIAVSSAMTFAVCQSVSVQASDIEIYKTADKGKVTLMMMVDRSTSMRAGIGESLYNDYGVGTDLCPGNTAEGVGNTPTTYKEIYCDVDIRNNQFLKDSEPVIDGTKTQGKKAKKFVEEGCTIQGENIYRCYSRLTRLKKALFDVLNDARWNDATTISNTLIGLSSFGGGTKVGRIHLAAKPLNYVYTDGDTQQLKLKKEIAKMGASFYTPTGQAYAETIAYMKGKNSGITDAFNESKSYDNNTGLIISSNNYVAGMNNNASKECRGDGIYFLTDGRPYNNDGSNLNAVSTALKVATGQTVNSYAVNVFGIDDSDQSVWRTILPYSQAINPTDASYQNVSNIASNYGNFRIKTATVGFASAFKELTKKKYVVRNAQGQNVEKDFYICSTDVTVPFVKTGTFDPDKVSVQNLCRWGQKTPIDPVTKTKYSDWVDTDSGYGEGGFYPASSSQDVVNSIFDFVDELKPIIPEVATGSPVVPVDNLNPLQLQPYGYYASFTPTPQESYQLWAGNLNKYHVKDGMLYGSDKSTLLLKLTGEFNTEAQGLWAGGVKGKLPLGTGVDTSTNSNYSKRTIYTNRKLTDATAAEDTSLHKVNLESLLSADTSKGLFVSDPKKNYWLNALGYNVAEGATGITLTNLPTVENRQVGAVMHSTPILLTQQGKIGIDTTTKQIVSTNRQDYLLFGSTQGILHVVKAGNSDADVTGGEEVFAFIPNEMMENYSKAFLPKEATSGGKSNLYYGVDAPWTAYTQYVTKSDGTSTVSDSGRKVDDNTDALALKGLQWVYGGLRMGGRSYYALDLSDIDKPSLKFHINPDANTTGPLNYMGKSWSKPTIAYVNWGGVKKLVMFVGGGYDMGYEAENYDQTTKQGAGVYMFDANNGDLLWWASANATASSAASTDSGVISVKNDNLKYSVVSQINAVDRNSDGLVDHLYFGDLGGQAFRIDLDNNAATKGAFTKRVFRLLNLHVAGGASPRFYEAPSFSIANGIDGKFATVAFSSGNRSSPLAGVEASKTTISANDGVFVVYDNDVARSDLYTTTTLKTPENSTSLLTLDLDKNDAKAADGSLSGGVPQRNSGGTYNAGWQYLYSNTAGKYKGMNGLYALDGYLYVNVFHKDGTGISGACNSGVRGDSYVYQFCLPYGRCPFTLPSSTVGASNSSSHVPYSSKLGAGILGTTLGVNSGGFSNVVTNNTNCQDNANKNKVECQIFDSKVGLKNLRWYESR